MEKETYDKTYLVKILNKTNQDNGEPKAALNMVYKYFKRHGLSWDLVLNSSIGETSQTKTQYNQGFTKEGDFSDIFNGFRKQESENNDFDYYNTFMRSGLASEDVDYILNALENKFDEYEYYKSFLNILISKNPNNRFLESVNTFLKNHNTLSSGQKKCVIKDILGKRNRN